MIRADKGNKGRHVAIVEYRPEFAHTCIARVPRERGHLISRSESPNASPPTRDETLLPQVHQEKCNSDL